MHHNTNPAHNLGKVKCVPYFSHYIINGSAVIRYAIDKYC